MIELNNIAFRLRNYKKVNFNFFTNNYLFYGFTMLYGLVNFYLTLRSLALFYRRIFNCYAGT